MIRITSLPRGPGRMTVEPLDAAVRGRATPKPITLLIIEDDPATRLALACMVADDRYQVVMASSAEDALDRLPMIDPDLILCDFLLEGMNGRQFCEALKSNARWRYVPVIVVTRMDAVGIVTDLLRSGADDVLVKPVRGEELRARVIAGLRTRMQYLQLGHVCGRYSDAAPQAGPGLPRLSVRA